MYFWQTDGQNDYRIDSHCKNFILNKSREINVSQKTFQKDGHLELQSIFATKVLITNRYAFALVIKNTGPYVSVKKVVDKLKDFKMKIRHDIFSANRFEATYGDDFNLSEEK